MFYINVDFGNEPQTSYRHSHGVVIRHYSIKSNIVSGTKSHKKRFDYLYCQGHTTTPSEILSYFHKLLSSTRYDFSCEQTLIENPTGDYEPCCILKFFFIRVHSEIFIIINIFFRNNKKNLPLSRINCAFCVFIKTDSYLGHESHWEHHIGRKWKFAELYGQVGTQSVKVQVKALAQVTELSSLLRRYFSTTWESSVNPQVIIVWHYCTIFFIFCILIRPLTDHQSSR